MGPTVGFVGALVGVVGMIAMSSRSPSTLTIYQIFGSLAIVLSIVLTICSYVQFWDIQSWSTANFDSGEDIRSSLDNCYCNNENYGVACGTSPNIICNAKTAGVLDYYTCTNGDCVVNSADTDAVKYCLSTSSCAKKAAATSQLSLALIGTMACWYLIYLLVCLSASSNVKAKMVEEQRQEAENEPGTAILPGAGVNTELV